MKGCPQLSPRPQSRIAPGGERQHDSTCWQHGVRQAGNVDFAWQQDIVNASPLREITAS